MRNGLPGKKLGNYNLTRLIGQGGFSSVYLGEHLHLTSYAAIKVLNADSIEKEVFLEEMLEYVKLEHPYILRILDFGVDKPYNIVFLVMEYIESGNIRNRHPVGDSIAIDIVVSYIEKIASALQYAHNREIIHQDVKPENIFINAANEPMLADFGVAPFTYSANNMPSLDITRAPFYMAPEQFMGRAHIASDQYSLGVMAYEWLCGQLPFQAGSVYELVTQHLSTPVPSLREHNFEISIEVEEIILRALDKDSASRFPSVTDFAMALAEASLTMQSSKVPSDPSTVYSTSTIISENPTAHVSPSMPAKEIKVFFAYSHEDTVARQKLEKHLINLKRQHKIAGWHDGEIRPGDIWEDEIDRHLHLANVILLLVSPDFIASHYCYEKELKMAMERHEAGKARVIPILLRHSDWKNTPLRHLQVLPRDARPITAWSDCDDAFVSVKNSIQSIVDEMLTKSFPPA